MGDLVCCSAGFPLPGGAIDFPVPFAFVLYEGVDPVNLGNFEGKGYMLRIAPFDAAATVDLPLPMPGGDIDFRSPMHATLQGASSTLYPAATVSRSSSPTDAPANTWVPAKFDGVINYSLSLFAGADPTSAGSSSIGVLNLIDPDGELDGLLSLGWDAAPLSILRGEPDDDFKTWSVVANMTTAGILYDVNLKEIKLRDLAYPLSSELHGLRYGGTGDADGDPGLANTIKPYAIGKVFNVPVTMVNTTNLIFQVSCSSIRSMTAVRDGGSALTFSADYSDYASLKAASVAGGHYATCLALGMGKVGSTAEFGLTADVEGDNDVINGHTYPSTRAQIARRIATARGGIRVDDGQIDAASYQALEQAQPATLGYFWNDEITKSDALNEVMKGCLGWWLVRLNGQLAFGQLSDPAFSAPLFTLDFPSEDSAGEVRVGELAMTDYQPPRRQTVMGYQRNYTVQSVSQLATALGADLQAIYGAASLYTSSVDPWVANNYPASPVVTVDGGFAYENDAQVEGDRQQRLLRTRRERFQLPVLMDALADVPARVIGLRHLKRFGAGALKNLFCPGITSNGSTWPVLELWG